MLLQKNDPFLIQKSYQETIIITLKAKVFSRFDNINS